MLTTNNDDMLHVYGNTGSSYYGGLAMNKVLVQQNATMRGTTTLKGGVSEHNPNGWNTLLPHTDGKNYIRGETHIQGNTALMGDVNVGRNSFTRGDQIFNGGNNWILHSPDNNSRTLYIAPSTTYGQQNWDFNNGIELRAVEKQLRLNNGTLCLGATCINEAQLATLKTKNGI
jgi:hypothetical protein